jgi:hypothetical protein
LMCLDVCRSENLGMVVGGYESFVNELDIVWVREGRLPWLAVGANHGE